MVFEGALIVRVVYICEQNCTVHKNLDTLVVRKNSSKLGTVPLIDVGCIVVFGNTQFSTQALNVLFSKGIDAVFMSSSGMIKGRMLSEKASNVILRIAQFDRWKDENIKIHLSRNIISAKVDNQLRVLEKYLKYTGNAKIKDNIGFIENVMKSFHECTTINALMGSEGIAARMYFDSFQYILKHFEFNGRQRRPAREPVNALLNLGYAFLNNEITTRLAMHSFDLELGFLHGIRYGRSSLALDLMEEFRASFIDEYTISLLNKRVFKEEDFDLTSEGCILKPVCLKRFCELYHEYIEGDTVDKTDWVKVFNNQIGTFRDFILNGKEYKPYTGK